MKRLLLSMLFLALIMTTVSGTASAKSNHMSEKELNKFLLNAGTPQEILESMDLDTKEFIYNNSSDGEVNYGAKNTNFFSVDPQTNKLTKVVEPDGMMSAKAYISSSDLKLTLYQFNVTSGGVSYKDIYAEYNWIDYTGMGGNTGVDKDHIAIAVPDGWEIQSGQYACANQWKADYSGATWSAPNSSACNNGNPGEYSLYGAGWQFTGPKIDSVFHKGTVKLRMRKQDSDAINRVVVLYSEANSSAFGYSVGFTWGPASVSITPNTGSNNTGSTDLSW
ncbi:hypothetical protein SAMN05444162_1383 [Paenibacillaceae bacterium GAS479]|nr:hypothetical protein SAMN05444162_1383 [Paenibacillaceae bacterium GAS479]